MPTIRDYYFEARNHLNMRISEAKDMLALANEATEPLREERKNSWRDMMNFSGKTAELEHERNTANLELMAVDERIHELKQTRRIKYHEIMAISYRAPGKGELSILDQRIHELKQTRKAKYDAMLEVSSRLKVIERERKSLHTRALSFGKKIEAIEAGNIHFAKNFENLRAEMKRMKARYDSLTGAVTAEHVEIFRQYSQKWK
jgi:chromosome segregation ATPase